jgi:hypothetical protein
MREIMDQTLFIAIAEPLTSVPTRRDVLRSLVGAGLGLGALQLPEAGKAKNKKRKKGKKRKHKNQNQNPSVDTPSPPPPPETPQPPPSPPPPPPARRVETRVFANDKVNLIPGNGTSGPARIYPSAIVVSGFTNGVILDVNVMLTGLSHDLDRDVDILLAASHLPGRNAIIMADAGGQVGINNVDLVLDDADAFALPIDSPIVSGSFRPSNYGGNNAFAAPAPAPTGNSALSTFNGQNPNGTWELFVMDDTSVETGRLEGWALQITAEVNA